MDWLVLAGIGIIWAACLLPVGRRGSSRASVETFERDMDLLANAQERTHGRWIVTPRKGVPFLGSADRARVRARERRRHVLVFLLESIVISFLIGIVPPLRVMWFATASLGVLLLAYVWLLLALKGRPPAARPLETASGPRLAEQDGLRPAPAGALDSFEDEDSVHVVVVPAGRGLSAAGA
jgi:hypothetical protein